MNFQLIPLLVFLCVLHLLPKLHNTNSQVIWNYIFYKHIMSVEFCSKPQTTLILTSVPLCTASMILSVELNSLQSFRILHGQNKWSGTGTKKESSIPAMTTTPFLGCHTQQSRDKRHWYVHKPRMLLSIKSHNNVVFTFDHFWLWLDRSLIIA